MFCPKEESRGRKSGDEGEAGKSEGPGDNDNVIKHFKDVIYEILY